MSRKVAVLVGSLRKESFSRKVANALPALAPEGLTFEQIEIGKLSFYNQDDEEKPPAEWVSFRDQIRPADAVLFVTPEYNRSVPAVLKNALDVGSRPYGKGVWDKKPGAIISVTPGNLGAFGANHHLRQSLVFVNVPTMAQPEAYLSGASKFFDAEGKLVVEATAEFLKTFLKAFSAWIDAHDK
jgi:chromate reductase